MTQRTRATTSAMAAAMVFSLLAPPISISTAEARPPATDYTNSLSGALSQSLCSSAGVATGAGTGDLPGAFEISLDCTEGRISGGTWRLVVKRTDPDGSQVELGSVSGRVLRGDLQAGAANTVAANGVEIQVTSGTGVHASVTDGTGSLDFTADATASPQFQGTIRLTF